MVQTADEASEDAGTGTSDLAATRDLIELGWLVVGHFEERELAAVDDARERMKRALASEFPDFDWRLPLARRERPAPGLSERPMVLLEQGILERDRRAWDYAFVVTEADLRGYDKPYTHGVPSRSVNVAVLSTARLDPRTSADTWSDEERSEVAAERILALGMHLFGHLNGLEHDPDARSYMHDFRDVSELEAMRRWSDVDAREVEEELVEVADPRLEETTRRRSRLAFYFGAARLNGTGIVKAVVSAKPWLLPVRLSRFTTAATSAAVILLVTAEVWDLAFSQRLVVIPIISALALSVTAASIVTRQRLLHRSEDRLTEQIVVTNIAVVVSVLIGLGTTFVGLSILVFLISWFLFPAELVTSWASSLAGRAGLGAYSGLAGFIASLGIAIGALGASFEEEGYFRHIAYVDEET